MRKQSKHKFKNQLALFRSRKSILQKQVATLLGHKRVDLISRYERGDLVPSLKTALKLGIIYQIPIRVLLDGYYEALRRQVTEQEEGNGKNGKSQRSTVEPVEYADFCTISEKLKLEHVEKTVLDSVARHSSDLIRRRSEKLGHF